MNHSPSMALRVPICIFLATWIFPGLGCAQEPFTPFKAPDLAVKEWLTPYGPAAADLTGRVYVVEFWASWCPPCRKSVKHLIDIQKNYVSQGLYVIALSQDTSSGTVRDFIAETGINYHVAMDAGSSSDFSVKYIPTVFIIDSTGMVVWRGYPWDTDFEKNIQKALRNAPPPVTRGVSLGPYEKFKPQLMGGSGFAAAYRSIVEESNAARPDSRIAASIIRAIDLSIKQKTEQALKLSASDPKAACDLLSDLVRDFGGIPATEAAARHLAALKSS